MAKRFLPEEEAEEFVLEEVGKNWARLDILTSNGIAIDRPYDLRFRFLSVDVENAKGLSECLIQRHGYSFETLDGIGSPFEIRGVAKCMNLNDDSIHMWTFEMCKVGFDFDCRFIGWVPILS